MRKVNLNMKELDKYNEIKRLVDKGTRSTDKKKCAVRLGVTIRTIDRLIDKYNTFGKDGFSHGNKGRPPSKAYPEHIKDKIISLYVKDYPDAGIKHFSEIVEEDLNIKISDETIRLWLLKKSIISPNTHRITKKRLKDKASEELKRAKSKKKTNEIIKQIETLDRKDVHPRRERCKYFGEMIQMDASVFEWVKGVKWTLHLAIDDATSRVVGAYFDYQETLKGYYNVFSQILMNYGIPAVFYTDRRTVFEYKRKNRVLDDEDTFTQFSYACHKLGVEIKTTSVPQAKGRIERLNSSFQKRLPIELRKANVKTIEEANIFLKSYLEKYNNQFSLQLNTTKTVFDHQLTINDINETLSVISIRTIDHGHTIHFKNKTYIPVSNKGNDLFLQEGMKVLVIETFLGETLINAFDNIYRVREVLNNKLYSNEFDEEVKEIEELNRYMPKKISWRYDDFLGFLAKQKHREDKANSLC